MTGSVGGYQVGFQLTPLGPTGDLTAHDFKGGPHLVEKDPIFHLCTENREKGTAWDWNSLLATYIHWNPELFSRCGVP